jgi:hypothetical protein
MIAACSPLNARAVRGQDEAAAGAQDRTPGRSVISASTTEAHGPRLLEESIRASRAVIAATSASVRLAARARSSLGSDPSIRRRRMR